MEARESSNATAETIDESTEMIFHKRRSRCCCLPRFIRSSSSSHRHSQSSSPVGLTWWQRIRIYSDADESSLWTRGVSALKKLREWSEIIAGPRWKTFIRRFNRSKSGGNSRGAQFQYDPLSYAMNFDEGPGQNGNSDESEEHYYYRNFSSRYASIPAAAARTASVDLGKDGPSFV